MLADWLRRRIRAWLHIEDPPVLTMHYHVDADAAIGTLEQTADIVAEIQRRQRATPLTPVDLMPRDWPDAPPIPVDLDL